MRTLTIGIMLGAVLWTVQCKKEEKDDVSPLLLLLGGGTTVICGGNSFCTTFVTTNTYNATLGGISGADSKCTAEKPSSLTGTFKALLISPGVRTASPALDWVFAASKEYRRQDQTTTLFTTDSSRLVSQPLTNPILGGALQRYWTGLDSQAWAHAGGNTHCTGWTGTGNASAGNTSVTAVFGAGGTGAFAVDTGYACTNTNYILCIQQ